jgi:hypothetical protein
VVESAALPGAVEGQQVVAALGARGRALEVHPLRGAVEPVCMITVGRGTPGSPAR